MDPDFIDHLILQRMARNDHDLFSIDKPDEAMKKQQRQRRLQLMHWREEFKHA